MNINLNSPNLFYLIEKQEKKRLDMLSVEIKCALPEIERCLSRSLRFGIASSFQLIMASKSRTYNPFSGSIEAATTDVLIARLGPLGYKRLYAELGSNIIFEGSDECLDIDIKTANVENLSDFRGTIPIGPCQTTHPAMLSLFRRKPDDAYLKPLLTVYPYLPPVIRVEKLKLLYTFALMFIYPSCREVTGSARDRLNDFEEHVRGRLNQVFVQQVSALVAKSPATMQSWLEQKSNRQTHAKDQSENQLRGIFIQNELKILDRLNIPHNDPKKIAVHEKIRQVEEQFVKTKPIAVFLVSIPNGLLIQYYNCFVSGKNHSKSTRFYYKDAPFQTLQNSAPPPRITLLYVNKRYKKQIEPLLGVKCSF